MSVELPGGEILVARELNALYGLAASQPLVADDDAGAASARERDRAEVNRSLLLSLGARAGGGWKEILGLLGIPDDASVLVHTAALRLRSPILVERRYLVRSRADAAGIDLGRRAATHHAFHVQFEFRPVDGVVPEAHEPDAVVTMTMVSSSPPDLEDR